MKYSKYPGFNALDRAYPISTLLLNGMPPGEKVCFNALDRAYPISTQENWQREAFPYYVSMPWIGLIPFLRRYTSGQQR